MARADNNLYAVQIVTSNEDTVTDASRVSVEAVNAAAAAEMVSETTLVSSGPPSRLRARVWHLSDDFSAVCTEFFEPPPQVENRRFTGAQWWAVFALICGAFALANALVIYFATTGTS